MTPIYYVKISMSTGAVFRLSYLDFQRQRFRNTSGNRVAVKIGMDAFRVLITLAGGSLF